MKRTFIYLFIVSLFTFVACKENRAKETQESLFHSNSKGKTKIKWLTQWYGEGKKETLVREIARDFMFTNQNYTVDIEFPNNIAKKRGDSNTFRSMIDTVTGMVQSNTWPFDIMSDTYFMML